MARLRIDSPSIASTPPRQGSARGIVKPTPSRLRHSSNPAFDQENTFAAAPKSGVNGTTLTAPQDTASPRSPRRRRLAERSTNARPQDDSEMEDEEMLEDQPMPASPRSAQDGTNDDPYDPKQPMEIRQQLRKSMRDLHLEAADNASEWMQPGNDGLTNALKRSDALFKRVKQTSDATIDARFLVSAGDLAHKRANNLITGDNAQGIDVDEFVGKCISFMRGGDASLTRRNNDDSDDEDGDPLDWRKLGMEACFIHNSRPSLPSFLLGPLSVQKRVRAPTQRRARAAQTQNVAETRPEEMSNDKLGEKNDTTLTAMCTNLHRVIKGTLQEARNAMEEWEDDGVSPEEIVQKLAENAIAPNGELWLFHLVINPASFGQTIENLFYLSFLIRDGLVGVDFDEGGMPTINDQEETDEVERQRRADKSRYQGILSLDYETWEELIDIFDLRNQEFLLIPDRTEEENEQRRGITAGWY